MQFVWQNFLSIEITSQFLRRPHLQCHLLRGHAVDHLTAPCLAEGMYVAITIPCLAEGMYVAITIPCLA